MLLTICIPTYKRPETLERCILSIAKQIEQYQLEELVSIYVTNDGSPDYTAEKLLSLQGTTGLTFVNREKNLGMSANIKLSLEEAVQFSEYQLIITDDDYLEEGALKKIHAFLIDAQKNLPEVPLIWTPRYSYRESGELASVVCNPFSKSTLVTPSPYNSSKYMLNGFVLSGLILKAKDINFSFWDEYVDNAYFPAIFTGEILSRQSGYYWHQSIVHHTVENECHWESWGASDAEIRLKLYIDSVNALGVLAKNLDKTTHKLLCVLGSIKTLRNLLKSQIHNTNFHLLNDTQKKELIALKQISASRIYRTQRIITYVTAPYIFAKSYLRVFVYRALKLLGLNKVIKIPKSPEKAIEQLENTRFIINWFKKSG